MLYNNITEYINAIKNIQYKTSYTNRGIYYIELPMSMDIETSSFNQLNSNGEEDKVAITYTITLDINHNIFICREWNEYVELIHIIENIYNLYNKRRCIIYIHNLSYEFQFMRHHFKWSRIFALDKREVVYAISGGIEYRCSYLLSGYSLDNLAEVNSLPIKKLTEKFDYSLIRTPYTELKEDEIKYIENDVEIIVYYIEKMMLQYKKIFNIPITKTQIVRRYTRDKTKNYNYNKMIHNLTIKPEDYKYYKSAFCGGFTHSNIFNNGKILKNITSFDLTSAYPSVMIMEQFPMSIAHTIENPTENDIDESLKYFMTIFVITYEDIHSKYIGDNIISLSRCKIQGRYTVDNGRIVTADKLSICITDLDYKSISDFYTYKNYKIHKIIRFYKNYLPKEFVNAILDLYEQKTKLKGIEDREDEYLNSKEMLNSMYGMTVTDILRDEIIYDDDWDSKQPDLDKAIKKYNTSKKRFLYYPWGIWVTSYVRRIIWNSIKVIGSDYVYSDTDSIKIMNYEKHKDYFEKYNEYVKNKITKVLSSRGIDIEKAKPKTVTGKEKFIGLFENEGTYKYFKTLGAKRYMYIDEFNHLNLTVSGLNKNKAVPYILEQTKSEYELEGKKYKLFNQLNYDKIFNFFQEGMYIPPQYTGKQTHTYIDYEMSGIVTDYNGDDYEYKELSSVHLAGADYELSLERLFYNAVMGVKEKSM